MADPLCNQSRHLYNFRCGYCGVSEMESGGELTVDHFQPASLGGNDTIDILVCACFRCNIYKSDETPFAGDPPQRRILYPLRDDVNPHFREDPNTGILHALTALGASYIAILRLNRPALIQKRLESCREELRMRRMELIETENAQLREMATRLIELMQKTLPSAED